MGNTTTTAHLGTVPTAADPVVDLEPAGNADAWGRGADPGCEFEPVRLDPPPGGCDLIDPAHPIHRGRGR